MLNLISVPQFLKENFDFIKEFYIEGWVYSEGSNTEHIGKLNVVKFGFPMVQIQDGCHFVLFSNGRDHWKTKIFASPGQFM